MDHQGDLAQFPLLLVPQGDLTQFPLLLVPQGDLTQFPLLLVLQGDLAHFPLLVHKCVAVSKETTSEGICGSRKFV